MSEKRFNLTNPITHNPIPNWVMIVHDDVEHKHMNAEEIVDLLNELSEKLDKKQEKSVKFFFKYKKLQKENEQLRQSHNKSECFYCKYCFRDDNYGVCCENRNSEYFTPHWDLHWENIIDCEYFERIGCDDV